MRKQEENNKYEELASFLDSSSSGSGQISSMEEERRKLIFLWKECHPEKTGSEGILDKTLQKIRDAQPNVSHSRPALTPARILNIAVSIALLIGSACFFSRMQEEVEEDEALKMKQYVLNNAAADDVKEVTLVVSDKKKIEIANNSLIAYTPAGQVRLNPTVPDGTAATEETEDEKEEYNQIIVPKGRRSMIVFADNSKIWINSGSKVIYPRSFKGRKRQIFIEGEVYLKVAPDETMPFVVNTSAFEVEVLGTSFNISAYKDSAQAAVVLVEGAVDVKDHLQRRIKMLPNERVELNEAGISKKESVNALEYIHWVDGVWILKGRPLKEILRYLTEYYGQPLHCDPSIENELFYGKLFLNEDLNMVLESIRQTLPATLAMKENLFYTDSIP
ncbi:MAG: FecR family protein [Mediterranea sp.]|nr:FecR family protein [Mediterranea sp.]